MRKRCIYQQVVGGYQTDCGEWYSTRPIGKCDKCGRKPQEKGREDVTGVDRPSDRTTR